MSQLICPTARAILLQRDTLLEDLPANTATEVSDSDHATWLQASAAVRAARGGDPGYIAP